MARGDGIHRVNVRNVNLTDKEIGNAQKHNEREKDSYRNEDIVLERSEWNVHYKDPDGDYDKVFEQMVSDGMISTTAFAAGHIVTYMMTGSSSTVSTDYSSVGIFVDNEKLNMTIPEKLSNGYEFSTSNIESMKGLDETGNTMGEGDVLQVTYKKRIIQTWIYMLIRF